MKRLAQQEFGGDWTTVKLDRVRQYLQQYLIVMSKQSFQLQYIDAFAGTGYRSLKRKEAGGGFLFPDLASDDTQKYLAGSARIALEVKPHFSEYLFIEMDKNKVTELEKLKQAFPDISERIIIRNGEANACIQDICRGRWAGKRAVMFLDPFGMQVTWDTIEAIAGTQAIDLWYLFPLGIGVNRLLRRDGQIDDSIRRRLDLIFGEPDWYDAFYKTGTELTLFGEEVMIDKIADFHSISDYLLGRLRKVFPGVASNPRALPNSRNNPIFLLCFACGNPKGTPIALKIAQHILKR